MARVPRVPARLWLALAFVTVVGVLPAAAQTTTIINQTSCINGTGSCLTNGVLQTIAVDCSTGGKISTALASIADREGPNTINVSGTCNEGLTLAGFNRLAIQGTGNTTITKGVNVADSGIVTFRGITFDFGGAAMNLNVGGGNVLLDGVIIKNSAINGLGVGPQGIVNFGASPSAIIVNGQNGILVNGGRANLSNVSIAGNGSAGDGEGRDGIRVIRGGTLVITNANVDGTDGPVDVSGSSGIGISIDSSVMEVNASDHPNALVRIHHNGRAALEALASSVVLNGHVKLDTNTGTDTCEPFLAVCQLGAYNSTVQLSGTQVLGGLLSAFHTLVVFESPDNGSPLTVTGSASLLVGATGLLLGGNTIDALTCDGTSWIKNMDHNSSFGSNSCSEDAPAASMGPKGDKGDKGDAGAQGPPGLSGVVLRDIVTASSSATLSPGATRTVTATCPASKGVFGGGAASSNPRIVVQGSIADGVAAWKATFANISGSPQGGTLTAQAICEATPLPLVITGLGASPSGPISLGSSVTFTATASGGTAPYTYEFWVNHGGAWTLGRAWDSDNTWTYTPSAIGAYAVQVWIRNAGSTATYDAWRGTALTVLPPAPLSVTTLTRSPSGALKAGMPITITATATGGTGPYTYQFYVYNGTSWTIGQAWSSSNTWQFTPGAGTYNVQVWVRNAGSMTTYDAWKGIVFTVVP